MTFVHTLVFSRATGLLVDEHSTVPPKIEDHVMMYTNDHDEKQDCFCFYFSSGAKCGMRMKTTGMSSKVVLFVKE